MAMHDKEIDDLFRSRLDDFEVAPSTQVWNAIDDELNAGKRKRILLPLLGVAASIIVLISAGLLFIPQGEKLNGKHTVKNNIAKIKVTVPVIVKATTITTPSIAKAKNITAQQHLAGVTVNRVARVSSAKQITPMTEHQNAVSEPVLAATEQREQLVAVVTDNTTPPTITQPAAVSAAIETLPVRAAGILPANTKPVIAKVKPRRRIHTLGDIINLAMAKVDKRQDKLVEFTNSDDDDEANITEVNLGIFKIKKDK